jgi:hypothetical protein
MNFEDTIRYRLELDMIERDAALGDERAIRLLRSEFALAINASHLLALSCDDIDVRVRSRSIPQEGVARYAVALELVERTARMTDEQAAELLNREFQRAQNAGYFRRIAGEDFSVRLVARERVLTPADLRAA